MSNAHKKDLKLEILVATMQRKSLDFLAELFPEDNFSNYNILIVNQTSNDDVLVSNHDTVRVINTNEQGLSKSRNLALQNATAEICLIADDDVRYAKHFEKYILEAFENTTEADVVTFKMQDFEGRDFKPYKNIAKHNKETIKTVNSVVIALKPKVCLENNVTFNEHFGLGAQFQTGEEFIFMNDALDAGLNLFFEPKVILSHDFNSSGRDAGSDRLVYSRSALYYKHSGFLGYLKLCKYLYLIYKSGYIKRNDILEKFKVGLKGISDYKRLMK